VREGLDAVCEIADPPYGWRITPAKVLEVTPAGARPAPHTLSGYNAKVVKAPWQQTQRLYRNSQWVQFGENGVRPYTSTWQGDGARRSFPIIGPNLVGELWPASPIQTVEVDAVVKPVGAMNDTALEWWYDPPPALAIVQNPTYAVLTAANTLKIPYQAQYPGAVFTQTAPPPAAGARVDAIDQVPATDDPYAAVEAAQALLRRYGITPRTSTVETFLLGFEPGQTVVVDLPPWEMSGTWLIETVQLRHLLQQGSNRHVWQSTLSLVEGDETRGSWLDFWRKTLLTRTGSGTGFQVAAGGGGGGGGTTIVQGSLLDLGGSRLAAQTIGTRPIVDFVDVLVNPADCNRYIARLHAWVVGAGTTVTPRIVALPSTVLATGTASTATSDVAAEAFQEITVNLSGSPVYLRAEASVAGPGEGYVAGVVLYPAPV
jgi:hypothetical protein